MAHITDEQAAFTIKHPERLCACGHRKDEHTGGRGACYAPSPNGPMFMPHCNCPWFALPKSPGPQILGPVEPLRRTLRLHRPSGKAKRFRTY